MAVCDNCGKDDSQWASRPCYLSTTGEHIVQKQKPLLEGEPETLRDRLAVAIYARNSKPEWLPTVDGSPNAASYDLADRVLVQLALEKTEREQVTESAKASYDAGYNGRYGTGPTGYLVCPDGMDSGHFHQGVNDKGWEGHDRMGDGANYKPPK